MDNAPIPELSEVSKLFPELLKAQRPAHKLYSATKRYAYGKRLKRNAHRRTLSVQQRRKAKNH